MNLRRCAAGQELEGGAGRKIVSSRRERTGRREGNGDEDEDGLIEYAAQRHDMRMITRPALLKLRCHDMYDNCSASGWSVMGVDKLRAETVNPQDWGTQDEPRCEPSVAHQK